MHLLIPHACGASEAATRALGQVPWRELPHLQALLGRLQPEPPDEGDEYTASPPHERAYAQLQGWQGSDGCWPFAARLARADGIDMGARPVALLTPSHWHLGTEQVSMLDPAGLHLDAETSRTLFEAVAALFEPGEGWQLAWGAPLRWYAMHPMLAGLKTAAVDRVIGRNVDLWLPDQREARVLRQRQVEAQMLLQHHPVNLAREARGELAVNSFWWSGCGAVQPEPLEVRWLDALRAPALAGDWPAWTAAWRALDAGPLREAASAAGANAAHLVLCGERRARVLRPAPKRWWERLTGRRAADMATLLAEL